MINSEEAWRILEEINRLERMLRPSPLPERMKEELEADIGKWRTALEEEGIFIKYFQTAGRYVFDYTKTPPTPLNPSATRTFRLTSTTGEMRAVSRETGPELSAISQLESLVARKTGFERNYQTIEVYFSQMTFEEERETLDRLITAFRTKYNSTS